MRRRPGPIEQHDRERQRQMSEPREGMSGAQRHGEWSERGEQLVAHHGAQLVAPAHVQLVPADDARAVGRALRSACRVTAIHPRHERLHVQRDEVELLPGREAIGCALLRLLDRGAFEPSHAHHEELVEIVAHDREETHALRERRANVFGERHHARCELEDAELGIQEMRIANRGLAFGGHADRLASPPGELDRVSRIGFRIATLGEQSRSHRD